LLTITVIAITSCDEESINIPIELNDITNPPGSYINKLAINSQGDFFAVTPAGLFTSTDRGTSWDTLVNLTDDILITADDYIIIQRYMPNGTALYRSSNNGNSWTEILIDEFYIASITDDKNGNIYVCGSILRKSSDKGNTWEIIFQDNVFSACITNSNNIVIGIQGDFVSQILVSSDNGISWDSTGYSINFPTFIESTAVLYAGEKAGDGVYKSFDEGFTWEFCGLTQGAVLSFVLNRLNKLIAGTSKGIYLTEDEGRTWQNVLADTEVTTLMKDKLGYLYAGTTRGAFLRSTDNGKTWHN
jgi:photosystem II stability/assembly factor-like uncharacterized protein